MIDIENVWIPQIIGYARLILGDELERVWIDNEKGLNSVSDYDELYEQIFDDLDSKNINLKIKNKAKNNKFYKLLFEFIESIEKFDNRTRNKYSTSKDIFHSKEWNVVRTHAKKLIDHCEGGGK